jgi:RNA polymerase sigma-70 factor, ECF subfamily
MPSKYAVLRTHSCGILLGLSRLPIVFLPTTREGAKLLNGKGIFLTIPQNAVFSGSWDTNLALHSRSKILNLQREQGSPSLRCVILARRTYTTCMAANLGAWAGEVQTESERIAQGLRKRDAALLHGLVEQYQYRLLRYFLHLTGRRDLVDDLIQDTWLRVLERGSQYDSSARFEPWLFAIARNRAIDSFRRAASVPLPSGTDGDEGSAHDPPSEDVSPFEEAARSEDAKRLASCLTALDPLYREVLVLRFQEDLSLMEIAEIVRAPVSTVSSRIYRGLAALRGHLEEKTHDN